MRAKLELVADGWIETTAPQSGILDAVIRQILESGRTVMIALKRDLTREEQAQRIEEKETEKRDEF